jgi:hypothetical protein
LCSFIDAHFAPDRDAHRRRLATCSRSTAWSAPRAPARPVPNLVTDRDLRKIAEIFDEEAQRAEAAGTSYHEQQAIPLLEHLVNGDGVALKDPEKFAGLAAFVAFQYMRTPKIMRASIEAGTSIGKLKLNIDAAWGAHAHDVCNQHWRRTRRRAWHPASNVPRKSFHHRLHHE